MIYTLIITTAVIIFRIWIFYTESPWTRNAKFSAKIIAISPDVTGFITDVRVRDNQLVKKGDTIFLIDCLRYQKVLDKAQANVAYYRALVKKNLKLMQSNQVNHAILSCKNFEQAYNDLLANKCQLLKAVATRDLALIDLNHTTIRAPSDGWITNLNVYQGEFITRGSVAVALIQQRSFYVQAYMEETKLYGVHPGLRADIIPLGSNIILHGTVDSIAAGITNSSSSIDSKGMANIDSNIEWVRLAQRVPVRIHLDKQLEKHFVAGTTATVMIHGVKAPRTKIVPMMIQFFNRLHEFG
ncbi:p-hydroxybenzoic acid efflux pump subunit AaeA [Candidatus Pantoea carbekii]|nr:p-hydroxybenzoic acid efflux pump subunit AaeA [Candidatus Pantoea carbekii]